MVTISELTKMIDQTLLKAFVSEKDLEEHCKGAAEYHFKSVAINGAAIALCKKVLEGSDVLCTVTIGFPLGQSTIESKVFETEDAIAKGANEIDYVVNITAIKSGKWDYVEDEMRRIVDVCNKHGVCSKVIFENCYLTDDEKQKLCEVALKVKPTFIKTSTGFGTGGATIEDVKLMKECVGDAVQIKAAGGIRNVEDALRYIEAGATRLGTSAGIEIIEGYRKLYPQK